MDNEILVSIYMTTYFHEKYVVQAIESILKQKVSFNYEIVISDSLIDNTYSDDFQTYLSQLSGTKIHLPDKFLPQKDLLDIHHQKYLASR